MNDPQLIDSPAYTAPSQFLIGTSWTGSPLVSVQQIKGHLALLGKFADLKNKVEDNAQNASLHIPKEKERYWRWFVALAVERYVSVLITHRRLFNSFCVKGLIFGAKLYSQTTRKKVLRRSCHPWMSSW